MYFYIYYLFISAFVYLFIYLYLSHFSSSIQYTSQNQNIYSRSVKGR